MKKLIWIIAAIATLVVLVFAVQWIGERNREKSLAKREMEQSDIARMAKWAYIAREKEIAPGETIKLLVIPTSISEHFNTKCLIYSNHNSSQMVCSDMMGLDNE